MDQPYVSVDVVPLSFDIDAGLRFGVTQRFAEPFAGEYALPGVLLSPHGERIADAAVRALANKAFIDATLTRAVRQLGAFDGPERDPRGPTISLAHVAVVTPVASVKWMPFADADALPFDHDVIVAATLEHTRNLLWSDQAFTAALTGETFSSLAAAQLVAAVTGAAPDKGNLNRTLAGDTRLTKLAEKESGRAGRPSTLWRWNE